MTPAVHARPLTVAVAANFTEPAKAIAAAFQHSTGNMVVLSFGPSGGIATQILHGAPIDLFLSADSQRPLMLERAGLTAAHSRFTYARGRLVLYSPRAGLVDARGQVLRGSAFGKLAIADPALAPYGAAAIETLRNMGIADRLAPRIVRGSSIAQAYQFIATGNADLGFVAQSQIVNVKGGSRWLVPEALHKPIEQQAVILKHSANGGTAQAFARFLRSPRAQAIIRRFGYGV